MCTSPEEKARASFDIRVAKLQSFLKPYPVYIDKQKYSKSPTGFIYIPSRFLNIDIKYDIEKTNSVVTPFIGVIFLNFDEFHSPLCGDIDIEFYINGQGNQSLAFTNDQDAIHSKDKVECYKHARSVKLAIKFAYQDGKWIYKEVINTKFNLPDFFFTAILSGQECSDRLPMEENVAWRQLVAD